MDERELHGLSCRFSKGRHSRHAALNDLVKCSLDSAKILSHLEPTGVYHTDGKRPNGATMVPWKSGRMLVWDVTCADTLAPSHRQLASREAGAVVASAEQRKKSKYAHLEATHQFVPIAIETLGVVGEEGSILFKDLGRRIADVTQDQQSHQFLLQRVSIAVQRGNAASVLATPSHRQLAPREAGAVTASAEQRKKSKYAHLEATHQFVSIAIETLGVVGEEGSIFFKDLGRRITDVTQEQQSHQFLLQRVSIAVQRGNAASVLGTLVQGERSVVM